MPFLKQDPDGGPDLEASYSIKGPDYEITNLNHADYTFPVDGWEYVDAFPELLPADVLRAAEIIAGHYKKSPKDVISAVSKDKP